MPNPPAGAPRIPDLPAHIPAISRPLRDPEAAAQLEWVALHPERVVGAAGLRRECARRGVRGYFGLHPGTKVALHFYAPDAVLERFWRVRRALYPALRAEFDLVFAPNFSVYEDSPRFEHLVNIRRAAVVAAEMAAEGVPAVPDVGWYCREDLDRWAEWLAAAGFPAVAFSFQAVGLKNRAGGAWRGYLAGLEHLAGRLPDRAAFVLIGLSSRARLAEAARVLGGRRACVVNTDAFMKSRKARVPGSRRDAEFAAEAARLARACAGFFRPAETMREREEVPELAQAQV